MTEQSNDTILPSKKHLLKVVLFGATLAIIGMFTTQYFMAHPPQAIKVDFKDIYISPDWKASKTKTTLHENIVSARAGNISELRKACDNGKRPETCYYLAEVFLEMEKPDSVMTYIPARFNTKITHRLKYVEVMALYFMGHRDLAKEALQNLPTDTPKDYLVVYNQMLQLK